MKLRIVILLIFMFIFMVRPIRGEETGFDFFKLFEEHGSIMLIIEADTGRIVSANRAAVDFYGYLQDDLLNMMIQDINVLGSEEVEAERRAAAEEERNYFVFPHRLAGGEIRIVEVKSYPFTMENTVMLYSVIQDVTIREQALKDLTESYERLRAAEVIAKLGHWEVYFSEDKVILSDGVKEIYGVEESVWTIEDIQQIPLPEYRPMLDKALHDLVQENKPYDVQFKIRRPSDDEIVDVHFIAEYNAESNTMLGVMQDITAITRAERHLRNHKNMVIYSMIIVLFCLAVIILLLIQNQYRYKFRRGRTRKNLWR